MKIARTFKTALTIIVLDLIMVNFSFAQKPVYLDSSQPIEKRVDDLLSRMTLEEKLGQLNMPYHEMMAKDLPAKIDAIKKFAEGKLVPNIGPAGGFWAPTLMFKEGPAGSG